jgi:phage shock protein C
MTRRGLYRSRNGVILGVCRGLADYFDFSVLWVRAIAVIVLIFTDFWPAIGLYILAALLMKSEPVRYARARTTNKADGRHNCAKQDTRERLKRKWQHLDRRIRRMEDKVTSHEFDWNNRFRA